MPEKEEDPPNHGPESWRMPCEGFAIDTASFRIAQPEWGEMVTIGVVDGSNIKIERPANSVAQGGMMPAALIGLALHDRIVELEERLAKLEVSS